MKKNAFYAQSGGVTSVINASAAGVIVQARNSKKINKVLAGKNGILGALREELIDTSNETKSFINSLSTRPGGIFGSCRYKLKDFDESEKEYKRLFDVFDAHNIGYFFYNGGNDSADTALKIYKACKALNFDLKCIAIPKTVDNDLAVTDCCPGFGSVAKYVVNSTIEASLDVESMAETSTKVFILEVMGRHAGWIAGSSVIAKESYPHCPDIILLPEVVFNKSNFLRKVKQVYDEKGFCVIVTSEGIRDSRGKFIAESNTRDAFGHSQLGGVAPNLSVMISKKLKLKNHWAVSDYLQRSARHLASDIDVKHAFEVGKKAVIFADKGLYGVMPTIKRISNSPYKWKIEATPIERIANFEKKLPKSFISNDGFGITKKGADYFRPLLGKRDASDIKNYPVFTKGKLKLISKKLSPWNN